MPTDSAKRISELEDELADQEASWNGILLQAKKTKTADWYELFKAVLVLAEKKSVSAAACLADTDHEKYLIRLNAEGKD